MPDAWVLGATGVVKTQILETLENVFEEKGISLIVLDWPDTVKIPPLACVCALAETETAEFLRRYVNDTQKAGNATTALNAIRSHKDFNATAASLLRKLQEPTLGASIAIAKNHQWLSEAFSDRKRARQVFGQVLAPLAAMQVPLHDRSQLLAELAKFVFGPPHSRVVVLLGVEGCGKSWLFAQSWTQQAEPPLSIVVPASDLKDVAAYGTIEPYLINRLIDQTGDSASDFKKKRWQRRFDQWKGDNNRTELKLIVFVDGLNQNPDFEWNRWLDGASAILEKLGGVLVLSTRHGYFRERIKDALCSEIQIIKVPEWTTAELSQILSRKGIDINNVNPSVVKTLQNPRILSIAFELLNKSQIESFAELSIERLLFEHIRLSAKENSGAESADQFKNRLSQHAEGIINRIKEQNHEDRLIFEAGTVRNPTTYNLSAELLAVTEGRFFHSLPEDPTLYSLSEEGLAVALGLAIIKALQKAERINRDLSETLDELLEPIAALDKTAQAVFAALLVACVDERCTTGIRRALITTFLRLQNIEASYNPAFSSAIRDATEAAMQAMFELSVSGRHVANKDWLVDALRDQRKRPECWDIISQHVDRWLRLYSLEPKLAVLGSRTGEGQTKLGKETEEKRQRIEKRLVSLPPVEKGFLEEKLWRNDGIDPSTISSDAFTLLAGMPLSDFSEALVAWSYSQSLNANYRAPYEEFQSLIRLNRRDWVETRNNLLKDSVLLHHGNASNTAKWALVCILRATSTLEDADWETALVNELTADKEKFRGWRIVEEYCPSDPCDPSSPKPDEIKTTAERYRQVDLEASWKSQWMGEHEHFLRDALPGLARFEAATAINVHRELTGKIIERSPTEFIRGLLSVEANTALVTPDMGEVLLSKVMALSVPDKQASVEARDHWIGSQYSLLIAFPHLDGDKQVETLMSMPPHGPTLLKLFHVLMPADPINLDRLLDHALQSGHEDQQVAALMFARYSGTAVSRHSRQVVAQLFESTSSLVRAQALNVISNLKDHSLLERVARSAWRAKTLDSKEQYFEDWYGSEAIIEAGVSGILSPGEVLNGISPQLFGIAARSIGYPVQTGIADRLDRSFQLALDFEVTKQPPSVEQNASGAQGDHPPLLSLLDQDQTSRPEDVLKRLSETSEEFEARQQRRWEAFDEFLQDITENQARLIIEDVGMEAIDAALSTMPERTIEWAKHILSLPEHKLMPFQNFSLKLASSLSDREPELARKLFERLEGRRSFITLTYGIARIPLEAISVWGSADNEAMDALRAKRLDFAATDHELALETMAALTSGKSAFLNRYAVDLSKRQEPSAVARALMVYGFGEADSESGAVLEQYASANGLIGTAAKAAQFAYDRNHWSRHWFELMCQTDSSEEFWRCSVLFLKIVDARFELWESEIERIGSPAHKFEPSIRGRLESRIKSWKKKREKTLFGATAPNTVFLMPDYCGNDTAD